MIHLCLLFDHHPQQHPSCRNFGLTDFAPPAGRQRLVRIANDHDHLGFCYATSLHFKPGVATDGDGFCWRRAHRTALSPGSLISSRGITTGRVLAERPRSASSEETLPQKSTKFANNYASCFLRLLRIFAANNSGRWEDGSLDWSAEEITRQIETTNDVFQITRQNVFAFVIRDYN